MDKHITYKAEILKAIGALGGTATLKEINDYIAFRNVLPAIKTNSNWKDNIRATVQRHCNETKSYRGAENLFYSVFGLGAGFWGLISMKDNINEMDITPVEKRIEKQIQEDEGIDTTEKEMIIKARVGQGVFREKLIDKYHQCIITGINDTRLLMASHVKPWRSSDNTGRLSPENGLLLSPLYDKLFDVGLLTFDKNMHIILSKSLANEDISKIYYDKTIMYIKSPSLELQRNMEYHRDVIYKA